MRPPMYVAYQVNFLEPQFWKPGMMCLNVLLYGYCYDGSHI